MSRLPKIVSAAAFVLALAGCVESPYRDEEPHHYSQDRYGNRLACYTSDLENQYDCFPVERPYQYAAYYYDKITGIEHGDTFRVGVRHKF